jgi:tetratricopeptide (TPR) repeat protein
MNYSRYFGLVAIGSFLTSAAQAGVSFHLDVDTHIEPLQSSKNAPSNSQSSFDVDLADRLIRVKSAKETIVFDFDKRKRTVIDNEAQTRVEYSLYDTVGFRWLELRNRERLGKALAVAKVGSDIMGTVDNEHILAIQDKTSTLLQTMTDNVDEIFSSESKVLFKRSLKATPVTAAEAHMFAQYLRYLFGGHPQILATLANGNAIPSKLVMLTYNVGVTTQSINISLVRPSESKSSDLATFPVRAATGLADPLDQLLDRTVLFTDTEVLAAKKRSKDELESLFRDGQVFDTFLAALELSWMTDEPVPALTSDPKVKVQTDISVRRLIAAIFQSKTKKGLADAIKVLTELRPNASAKSYVLKILEANYRAKLGDRTTARKLYIDALTANPYIAGAYKDLGDVLIMGFDMPGAWRCWDQGRKIAPLFATFGAVKQFENALAANHPEFF